MNGQIELTFAVLDRHSRRCMDRGFAFYDDREGRRVFVHIKAAREVTGKGDELVLTGKRDESRGFPTQIVLKVVPGRRPGQFQAAAWGQDPEPHLRRYTTPWHEGFRFKGGAEKYVGGETSIHNESTGKWGPSGQMLISFSIDGEEAVIRFSNGRVVRDKWWNFHLPRDQPPYGRAKLELHSEKEHLSIVFYPRTERQS